MVFMHSDRLMIFMHSDTLLMIYRLYNRALSTSRHQRAERRCVARSAHSAGACAKLRAAVDAASFSAADSVDGCTDYQLNFDRRELESLVGEAAVQLEQPHLGGGDHAELKGRDRARARARAWSRGHKHAARAWVRHVEARAGG